MDAGGKGTEEKTSKKIEKAKKRPNLNDKGPRSEREKTRV